MRTLNLIAMALALSLWASPALAQGKGNQGGDRGPAFCRSGQGHPVHGRRWCIEKGFGLGPYRDSRRYEDRRDDDYGRYGSYDQAHRAFHRDHDRICRERASQRPFDVRWQLRVRAECKARHDEWHRRTGTRH